MKFIQVFNRYLHAGGEETSSARIAAHLRLGGHEVIPFWRASSEWSVPGAPGKLKQLFLMRNNPAVLNELRELHQRERPDTWILHNVVPVISLGVYRLALEQNVPILQWLHNYRPISPSGTLQAGRRHLRPNDPWIALKETVTGSWRGRLLTGWIALAYAMLRRRGDFESVRAWIAVSDEMRRIFEQAGWPADRLFTLRHAWDIQPGQWEEDEAYYLYLGRMIEAKGVQFLVDLWRRPELGSVRLVMAGDGPLHDELKNQTGDRIRWAGFVKGAEKRRLIARCRAVLFPSLWPEPLSTVAYEAYEMKKPILASRVGGMSELIIDGETGRLLPAGDFEAWQSAILQLTGNADLARRWGGNGRQWLEQNASPANWNRQFNTILERAVLKRGSAPV